MTGNNLKPFLQEKSIILYTGQDPKNLKNLFIEGIFLKLFSVCCSWTLLQIHSQAFFKKFLSISRIFYRDILKCRNDNENILMVVCCFWNYSDEKKKFMCERFYKVAAHINGLEHGTFHVQFFYRNLGTSPKWTFAFAAVNEESFMLDGNQVTILRSVTGNNEAIVLS